MQIKLHGIFKEDYPDEYFIEADTVAEVIEAWSRQVGFYADRPVEQRPIVRVVGRDTEESLYEITEQNEVHLVPAMLGGGGSFGKILMGAALIGLSFIPGIGQAAQIALISMGSGMVLQGVMGFFMKAPTVSQSNDPEASKYLGLSNNTTSIGTPIAICYGTVPVNGHVLALNIDSTNMLVGTFPTTPT